MVIRTCPFCGRRVVPMSDGGCPSCRATIPTGEELDATPSSEPEPTPSSEQEFDLSVVGRGADGDGLEKKLRLGPVVLVVLIALLPMLIVLLLFSRLGLLPTDFTGWWFALIAAAGWLCVLHFARWLGKLLRKAPRDA